MTDVENATAALSLDDALDGGGDNNPFAIEKQADDEKLKKEERAKKFGTNARMDEEQEKPTRSDRSSRRERSRSRDRNSRRRGRSRSRTPPRRRSRSDRRRSRDRRPRSRDRNHRRSSPRKIDRSISPERRESIKKQTNDPKTNTKVKGLLGNALAGISKSPKLASSKNTSKIVKNNSEKPEPRSTASESEDNIKVPAEELRLLSAWADSVDLKKQVSAYRDKKLETNLELIKSGELEHQLNEKEYAKLIDMANEIIDSEEKKIDEVKEKLRDFQGDRWDPKQSLQKIFENRMKIAKIS